MSKHGQRDMWCKALLIRHISDNLNCLEPTLKELSVQLTNDFVDRDFFDEVLSSCALIKS